MLFYNKQQTTNKQTNTNQECQQKLNLKWTIYYLKEY